MSSALHDRLLTVAGDHSYRQLGELTHVHPETVRRYMQGQAPSAEFLAGMCSALEISGDWLLTGRGPMRHCEQKAHALKEADAGELLSAVATTLETLLDRVDRLERYVQTMETRLRVANGATLDPAGKGDDVVARARKIAGAIRVAADVEARA